jgi:succinate dehydrogenase/fumarate reductase flavoprotein subunit
MQRTAMRNTDLQSAKEILMDHQAIETEVVVVGYGGAGAAAAITAHDHGAGVIVLEKMPAGGGNSRLSAAMLISATGTGAVQHVAE